MKAAQTVISTQFPLLPKGSQTDTGAISIPHDRISKFQETIGCSSYFAKTSILLHSNQLCTQVDTNCTVSLV